MTHFTKEDKEKIDRFIDGKADEAEKAFVETMFLNGEENYTLRNTLESDWSKIVKNNSDPEINLSHLLDKVHHTIRINESKKKNKPVRKLLWIYTRAAAVLLLPLLLAGFLTVKYFLKENTILANQQINSTIYAPMGARVTFNLPDGTKGMLNSGSKLSYSIPFLQNRKVQLEGEAWLEVNHDKNNPFEIYTGNSVVKVLGTSLNVSAYPEEKYVEVVLLEGKVSFINSNNHEIVSMVPSERLVFKNGNIIQSVADPGKYNAWTQGKLVFRGDNMTEVARRIERWYNVKIILSDPDLEKYSFRATFEDDKIEEVLRFLSMTSPIKYHITPRKLLADGTFDKQIVTISIKK